MARAKTNTQNSTKNTMTQQTFRKNYFCVFRIFFDYAHMQCLTQRAFPHLPRNIGRQVKGSVNTSMNVVSDRDSLRT